MDQKGIVFSTDLLLALVIVTLAMGLMTNQFEEINYQLQDFVGRASMDRTVNDAADYLVKSPGNPTNWHTGDENVIRPGLAIEEKRNPVPNFLHLGKITKLNQTHATFLPKLVHTNNYHLQIITIEDNNILYSMPENYDSGEAKEIAVANRSVMIMGGEPVLNMPNLTHMVPPKPGGPFDGPTHLWYAQGEYDAGGIFRPRTGRKAIFVGPGNGSRSSEPLLSQNVTITQEDLNTRNYYFTVVENTATQGAGVSTAEFGFTDYDAVVTDNNGELIDYGPFNNRTRRDNIDDELRRIYGGGGWQDIKIPRLRVGGSMLINDEIQKVLDADGGPELKLWVQVPSNPQGRFELAVVWTPRPQELKPIPAKLVLSIWE